VISALLLASLLAASAQDDTGVAAATEPPPTERTPLSVSITNDFEIRYWVRPERLEGFPDRAVYNYFETVDRLNLSFGRGPWTVIAQFDTVVLTANRYKLDGTVYEERDLLSPDVFWPIEFGDWYLNPEKLGFRWQQGELSIKVGDYYAAFGTGLSLNLARNVDVDIDTSLQGAHVLFRSGAWDLTALIGQANRQQVSQDNPNIGIYGDIRHLVGAVRLERYGLGPAHIGVHGAMYSYAEEVGFADGFAQFTQTPDAIVGGGTVELASVLGIDWTFEGDGYFFPTDVAWGGEDPRPGYAFYGAATWYLGPTTWQLEGKRYRDAERINAPVASELYEVAVGPSLEYERAINEDTSATMNSEDVTGGRLRMDWSAVPGEVIPYASVAVFRDTDTGGAHFNDVPETIVHPMLGIESFGEAVTVLANAGFRMDLRDEGVEGDRQLHGDLDVKVPIAGPIHLDVAVAAEWWQWGDNELQQTDYAEVESSVSVLGGSTWAVTWFTDFSDNPLIDTKGNLSDTVYGALEVQVQPTDALTLKAFYGAYKSGIRCAGGQCRVLPGFEGARLSVQGSF